MVSKQIKMTVTANESRWLEQKAAERGISVSAFLHERIFGRDHKTLIGYDELSPVCMNLPTALLNELKEDANNAGYSLSKYVTILCAQKGRPVIMRIDPASVMREQDDFCETYAAFVDLMNEAVEYGFATRYEADALIHRISLMWQKIADQTRVAVAAMQRKLNREIKEVKDGNHQDNTDT